jgi:hypothetical protein
LAKIKKLIQIYATAQPSKRLSLKVLKAKNENNNWIYAPAPNATLIDAALKIVGTDVTSNCTLKTWPPDSVMNFEQPQTQLESEFGLVALLPDSGAGTISLIIFLENFSNINRLCKTQQCWPIPLHRWQTDIQLSRNRPRYL